MLSLQKLSGNPAPLDPPLHPVRQHQDAPTSPDAFRVDWQSNPTMKSSKTHTLSHTHTLPSFSTVSMQSHHQGQDATQSDDQHIDGLYRSISRGKQAQHSNLTTLSRDVFFFFDSCTGFLYPYLFNIHGCGASGEKRRTGVSPGEAAHHCSTQGRRISLANIVGNMSPKCTKEVRTGSDSHRVAEKEYKSCLTDGLTPCLSVCLWWTAASRRLQTNVVVNTEAPPGEATQPSAPRGTRSVISGQAFQNKTKRVIQFVPSMPRNHLSLWFI